MVTIVRFNVRFLAYSTFFQRNYAITPVICRRAVWVTRMAQYTIGVVDARGCPGSLNGTNDV